MVFFIAMYVFIQEFNQSMMQPEVVLDDNENTTILASETATVLPVVKKVISIAVFFILMFQTLFRLSDAATSVLFHFLSLYFKMMSKLLHSSTLESVHFHFPSNVSEARRFIGSNRNRFQKYACCQICHSIHLLSDCFLANGHE